MKSLSKVLAGLVLLGLLAIGVFSFGEQGILSESLQHIQKPQRAVENVNKITVAEITNEKKVPLDPNRSKVILNTFINSPGIDLGFDHLLNAREFDGTVVFADNEPAGLKLHVRAPVNLPSAELPKAISEHDKSNQNDNSIHSLRNYPTMVLTASSLIPMKGNMYALKGLFSLHGVTRPIHMPVTLKVSEDLIRMRGELSFLQSDYSIASYNNTSHTIQNKDKVVLKFDLSASAN